MVTFGRADSKDEGAALTTDERNADFRDGMPFLGGAVWIDLLNSTLSPDGGATKLDFLAEPTAFDRWLSNARIERSADGAGEAAAASKVRDQLRPAFERLAAGQPLSRETLDFVNAGLSEAHFVRRLAPRAEGYCLEEAPVGGSSSVVAAIAFDFARFVSHFEAQRMKHCANPTCTMVFYDRGKNNHRRWCSSAVCGNRDKVANYRARRRPTGKA
jgi:predicted RNA-binding Zn ribbon-like protein